ncbi:Kelch motif-containing protein [Nitzschia inconspicua]|uniref:Kelch motif-containing protein n=1 Tax=Nitzschia inconspicua TaxID=303405 RepID=A0A9K3PC33_9STRA|nr:Kelch motif-containing protein [Nitzschia inconspicua]
MKFAHIIVTFLAASASTVRAEAHQNLGWGVLGVRLPEPLSDLSATLDPATNLIYIAGGCDSPNGNEFAGEYFVCATISDDLYVFNPQDWSFGPRETLPRQRYRHCAEIVNNQLWLLGGRDADDALITEIDVYDIAEKSWSVFTLPDDYLTSDQACFTDKSSSFFYVAGGYNATYGTRDATFRIDTSTASANLVVEEMAPLIEARGDVFAASDGEFAYLGGGFTDANGFCAPLETAETYEFATNTWTNLPPLINERGEIVMVEANGDVFALGGERQIQDICDVTGDTDPGELTVGTEVVEVLTDSGWKVIESFDDHKFRFAAVNVDGLIYAFGGQDAWDDGCQCFKTTDEIHLLGDGVTSSPTVAPADGGLSGPTISLWAVSAVLGVVAAMVF